MSSALYGCIGDMRKLSAEVVIYTSILRAGHVHNDSPLPRCLFGDDCNSAGYYVRTVLSRERACHIALADLCLDKLVDHLTVLPVLGVRWKGGPCSLQNWRAIMGAMRVDADTGISTLALPAGVNDRLTYIQSHNASVWDLKCRRPTHPPGQVMPTTVWPDLCAYCIYTHIDGLTDAAI